tara:strand:+ start:412 stop:576 length:165 start_codon:yes stop_codon:yes gene_type:complete
MAASCHFASLAKRLHNLATRERGLVVDLEVLLLTEPTLVKLALVVALAVAQAGA